MEHRILNKVSSGVLGIAITTMNSKKEIDEKNFRKHLQFMVSNGINKETGALIVGGSTGECAAMTLEERKRVVEIAIDEVASQVPVIVGCNHTDVWQTIELVRHAETSGAVQVMILPQYYFTPPTDQGVAAFYKLISKETNIGILFYNNVGLTNYDVPVSLIDELADTSHVVGIKECTPWIAKMEQMVRKTGDRIAVFNGQGEFFEPYAALTKTPGFISSTANVAPKLVTDMWKARSQGDFETAISLRERLTPYLDLLVKFSSKGGEPAAVAMIKKATDLVGSFAGPGRLPLLELSASEETDVKKALVEMGLI